MKVLWKIKKALDNEKNRVYIISSQTKRVLILKQYRTKANINEIRFLKKLFWTVGISPERRTKVFISAKQNADTII